MVSVILLLSIIAVGSGSPIIGGGLVLELESSINDDAGQKYPFLVHLRLTEVMFRGTSGERIKDFTCGGTLISREVVLTAAHCLSLFITEPKIEVTAGTVKRRPTELVQKRFKNDYLIHEDYVEDSFYKYSFADLALIWVDLLFDLTTKVQVARFSTIKKFNSNAAVFAAGWGVSDDGYLADELKEGELEFISRKLCQKLHIYTKISKTSLCIISKKKDTIPCHGDSGGPLVVNNEVVGVASWVGMKTKIQDGKEEDVCDPEKPAVYTNVGDFQEWITWNLEQGSPKRRGESATRPRTRCKRHKLNSCIIS